MVAAQRIAYKVTKRVGTLYFAPPSETLIAWLWVRTATCPSPACGQETVLTSSWWLSKKRGDLAWIAPEVGKGQIRLRVIDHQASGQAPAPPKVGDGVFACLHCGATINPTYLKEIGRKAGLGLRMSAVVTEAGTGRSKARHYREPSADDRLATLLEAPEGVAEIPIPAKGQGVRVVPYGMTQWADVFTPAN